MHHSDRGSQYMSIRYTERLAEARIEPSVGSVGDSYENALAETINGLYKAEVLHRRGPWRSFSDRVADALASGTLRALKLVRAEASMPQRSCSQSMHSNSGVEPG